MKSPKFHNLRNHRRAAMHFWPELNGKCKPGWNLHHKDPSLKKNDLERYYQWNPDDLIPMKAGDHWALHSKLLLTGVPLSEEHKANLSKAKTGKHYPKLSEAKMGHEVDAATRLKLAKMSAGNTNVKGRKYMHKNGVVIMVYPSEISLKLKEGWLIGRGIAYNTKGSKR